MPEAGLDGPRYPLAGESSISYAGRMRITRTSLQDLIRRRKREGKAVRSSPGCRLTGSCHRRLRGEVCIRLGEVQYDLCLSIVLDLRHERGDLLRDCLPSPDGYLCCLFLRAFPSCHRREHPPKADSTDSETAKDGAPGTGNQPPIQCCPCGLRQPDLASWSAYLTSEKHQSCVSSGSAEGWLHSRRDRKVSGMLQAFLEQVAHSRSSLDLLATAHFVVTRLPDSERRSRTRVYSAIKAARPTASEEVVRNVLTDLDSIRNVSFEMAKS
jgi:hypothetical protein